MGYISEGDGVTEIICCVLIIGSSHYIETRTQRSIHSKTDPGMRNLAVEVDGREWKDESQKRL